MSLDQGGRMELEEQRDHDLDQRVAGLVRRLVGDLQSRLNDQLEHSTDEIHQAVDEHLRHTVEDLRQSVGKHLRQGIDSLREHLARTSESVPESLQGSEELAALTSSSRLAGSDSSVEAGPRGATSADLLAAAAAIDKAPTEPKKRQQQILDALIRESAAFSDRAAVFLARGEAFMGWNSRGFSEDGSKLRNHSVAANADPALVEVSAGDACVGLTSEDCARVSTQLGIDAGVAGILVPLVLRDKVAGVLYADRAAGGSLDVAALQLLVHLSALAIESLPLRKREQTCTLTPPAVEVSEHDEPVAAAAPAAPAPTTATPAEPVATEPAATTEEPPAQLLSPEDQPTTELEAASLQAPPQEAAPAPAAPDVVHAESESAPPVVLDSPATEDAPPAPAAVAPEPAEPISSVAPPADDSLATMRWDQAQLQEQLKAEREKLAAEKQAAESAALETASDLPVLDAAPSVETPAPPAEATPEVAAEAVTEPAAQEATEDAGDETHPGAAAVATEATAAEAADAEAADAEVRPPAAAESAGDEGESEGGRAQVAPPEDIDGPGRAFAGAPAENSELEAKKERARRLARLLVSEIKLYNEEQVEAGRSQGNIYAALREDIDRSRQMYVERVDAQIRDSTDFFHEELVRMLAGGDASVLGI